MSAAISWSDSYLQGVEAPAETALTLSDPSAQQRWRRIQQDITRVRSLRENWDGMGTTAPELETVENAAVFAVSLQTNRMLPPTRVVPSPDGSILLQWETDGGYLEAEVSDPGHIEWMLVRRGAPAAHWTQSWPEQDEGHWVTENHPVLGDAVSAFAR